MRTPCKINVIILLLLQYFTRIVAILQIDQLKEQVCERIFKEKITGTKIDRPELEKLLAQIRSGDTIIVTES